MACGVRKFFKDHGAMPLSGTLPDMKAQSSDYIELQNIYKSKAMEDVNLVTSNIRHLERDFPSRKPISLRDITAFCKNSQYMQMIPDKRIEEKPRTEFDVKFSEYPTDSEIKGIYTSSLIWLDDSYPCSVPSTRKSICYTTIRGICCL
jgi:hypothetical protein